MCTVWLENDGTKNFQNGSIFLRPLWSDRSAPAISGLVSIVKIGDVLAILSAVENCRHCGVFEREIAKFQ